jgi:hypothetical protein
VRKIRGQSSTDINKPPTCSLLSVPFCLIGTFYSSQPRSVRLALPLIQVTRSLRLLNSRFPSEVLSVDRFLLPTQSLKMQSSLTLLAFAATALATGGGGPFGHGGGGHDYPSYPAVTVPGPPSYVATTT